MKILFNLILSGILLSSFTSCSTYYINTLSSVNMVKDSNTGEFQFENDSVKISYGFAGENAPVKIKVHNKLRVPLFVDWTRSSMIYNGQSKGFIPDEVKFSGNISTNTWNERTLSSAESTINGSVQSQKQVSFIPPNANFETIIKSFDQDTFENLSDSLFKERDVLPTVEGQVKVNVGNFDSSNSPLSFRTYITFYTQDGLNNNIFSLDREFYVSKSVRTSGRPHTIINYNRSAGDVFYTSKPTGYGKTMTGFGVAAAVVGAAALAPEESQK